jgi:uncharacterized protein YjlB
MYLLYIFPPELHTLTTSITHPRKILLVVLQIGKAKDLSASLRISGSYSDGSLFDFRSGIRTDLEGGNHGITEVPSWHLTGRTEENHGKLQA